MSRFFFILLYILLLLELKNRSLYQGLRYRGSTVNIHFHIKSIFAGIRIFRHLNLLLVSFDPISDV